MSRIHDALRKANLNQEALAGVEWLDSLSATEGVAEKNMPETLPIQEVAPESPAPVSPISKLAEYPPLPWTFDPHVILASGDAPSDHATEQFRLLRSRLYQLTGTQALKSLIVTSALPLEGKSFVAANLARVLALNLERRVLLIDGDLRSPRLHLALGTSLSPGLSENLLQEAGDFEILQRGSGDNFFFVPAGRPVKGPTELLSNGRFGTLITRLEEFFDWIVVDAPSTLPVSDTSALAESCDGVLMVVRSNSTPFDIVQKALDRFPEDCLLGVVLNEHRVPKNRHNHARS